MPEHHAQGKVFERLLIWTYWACTGKLRNISWRPYGLPLIQDFPKVDRGPASMYRAVVMVRAVDVARDRFGALRVRMVVDPECGVRAVPGPQTLGFLARRDLPFCCASRASTLPTRTIPATSGARGIRLFFTKRGRG